MQKIRFLIIVVLLSHCYTLTYSQNVPFTDLALKNYLLSENSVDTNNNGLADININVNNDTEIQLSELQAFEALHIGILANPYPIKSIQDLSGFHHLKKLILLNNDSLTQISNLNLDSLTFFWIGSCSNLKHIDLSDLPAITDLRIEDISDIDYLNLKNGSLASNLFSLFYSENIQYACVDSIAAEYNQVQQQMAQGKTPSINCVNSVVSKKAALEIEVYPNPSSSRIYIKTDLSIVQIYIYGSNGLLYSGLLSSYDQSIDIEALPAGIYTLQVFSKQGIQVQKFIKK